MNAFFLKKQVCETSELFASISPYLISEERLNIMELRRTHIGGLVRKWVFSMTSPRGTAHK